MEVTLTALNRTERTSKKTGKPFVSVGIKTNVHGDKWLSGFASIENADWAVGDTVNIEVATKGEYLNFTVPKEQNQPSAEKPDEFKVGNAEIKNLLTLKVIPLLEKISDRQLNLDPDAQPF